MKTCRKRVIGLDSRLDRLKNRPRLLFIQNTALFLLLSPIFDLVSGSSVQVYSSESGKKFKNEIDFRPIEEKLHKILFFLVIF